jgi:hypothetical protein
LRARAALTLGLGALCCSATLTAFDPRPDTAALERAIALGRSASASALDRFGAPYRVPIAAAPGLVGDPSLDHLELMTPFRRVVLAASEQARQQNPRWGVPQAAEFVRPYRDAVSLILYLRFPPQNVLVTMPRYEIVLYRRDAPSGERSEFEPREIREVPRSISGTAVPPGSPIVVGSIEAVFDARLLDPRGVYLAGIRQGGRELRRVEVDFRQVE